MRENRPGSGAGIGGGAACSVEPGSPVLRTGGWEWREMSDMMARTLAAGIMMSEGRGQVALSAGWEERAQTEEPFIG